MNITGSKKDGIEEVANKEDKREQKFKGRIRLKRGHRLFEFNMIDFTLVEIDLGKKDIDFVSGNDSSKRKATISDDPNCHIIPALNRKNAAKKLKKEYNIKPEDIEHK